MYELNIDRIALRRGIDRVGAISRISSILTIFIKSNAANVEPKSTRTSTVEKNKVKARHFETRQFETIQDM